MKTFIIIIYFSIAASVFSQFQQWANTYNGSANSNDEAYYIAADQQGNIIVSGRITSTGNNSNFGTVKYSSSGTQLWEAVYDGAAGQYDEPNGLTVDGDGNVYVTGMTRNASFYYDIAVIKYNSAGIIQWTQVWAGPSNLNDEPAGIYVDGTGNVYVTGNTEVTSNTNYNYITLKYNSAGALQWAKQYNHPMNNYDKALFIAGSGDNIYVCGNSNAPVTYLGYLTIKYNSNGDSLWTARYDASTSMNEIPYDFKVDAQGNVYVTGMTHSTSSGVDWITLKYNTNGAEQWQTRYTSPGNAQDIPEGLAVDAGGNVYVTGRTRINSTYNDFGTIKYNSSGVQQWLAVYDYTPQEGDDYGYDIAVDNSGNVYVTGNSQQTGSDRDALTIKYNSSGTQQWVARYDSTNSEEAYAMALDANNNVYVTGYTSGATSNFLTVKYSQVNAITQLSNEIPKDFMLSQNYPNPFNPITNINFSIPAAGNVKISVYDISGREISVLVNENLGAGEYKTDFDASGLSSGVYFYKMETGKYSDVKKMILTK